MAENGLNGRTDIIHLNRERYESLLIELGELRKLNEVLLEYKASLQAKEKELKEREKELEEIKEILLETEWKDYELDMTQKRLKELEAELARLKANQSWWRRLFGCFL